MRIAELSRSSGVSVPTIKYYVREGLLPPGELTSRNQAQYTGEHLRRLRLARALIEVGGLPVAAAKRALSALDAAGDVHHALGKAQYAATPTRPSTSRNGQDGADGADGGDGADEDRAQAMARVEGLLTDRGWRIKAGGPALRNLVETVTALHRLGQDDMLALLGDYADAAEALAKAELPRIAQRATVDGKAEAVVLWTVLGDALLAALRRLAQENESAGVFGAPAEDTAEAPPGSSSGTSPGALAEPPA